ncbi:MULTISPECIES: DUF1249 domain-containing protein [Methanosarcina]|uniref:DUF6908 domain-containing protein n=1 Tax=Methanosarcina vacuolata Z-761 TaxID=1434123 RepID=A0A0E3LGT0_9EURY|nr:MULTISPECIES: DUF1249 domain-containing protein [Methanosarcina]AKB43056.1 hypothetical protein MSVAZ_0787 [Methanosarcina vacuolata Z-761]MDW5549126.1 DUF1249 domain-containing protein [Methanosarcina sp.]MDW5549155.1 DUF1249 domain-containing protein [Methanosarcina sp.]MDW5553139.1 DUF1249 domain-containing protein [Methanosarcina sp.]MDW5559335.1 DUF1249 domain-containing protein [Methanosarcina sp.]
MRRTVYEIIFARFQQMRIIDESGEMQADYMKFVSSGLMPLNVDKLTSDTIALAHNGKQNGDVMADPDMEVRIYPELKMAEALTFRNDYMGIYQEVYPEPGKYYPKLKKELNYFLNNWLKTMIDIQGYRLTVEERE